MKIIPIILSGGAGTRLWPLSVNDHPKQFLSLVSERTMIQDTLLRLKGLELGNPIVSCLSAAIQAAAIAGAVFFAIGSSIIEGFDWLTSPTCWATRKRCPSPQDTIGLPSSSPLRRSKVS